MNEQTFVVVAAAVADASYYRLPTEAEKWKGESENMFFRQYRQLKRWRSRKMSPHSSG